MAYCGECGEECEVERDSDCDGDDMFPRVWTWIQSKCCAADAYADEALTEKLTARDVDYPEPATD